MKKTLVGLAVLFALGGIGVYLAFNYIDVIVKVALEHWGPDVTGVSVKVGEVEISPRDVRGSIRSLTLEAPQLTDVGRRQNGVTASEAAGIVASTLQTRIAQKVLTNFDLLRKGGIEGAVDALKGLLK